VDKTTCSVDGCNRPAYCRGWCNTHYQRWRAGKDMTTPILEQHSKSGVCAMVGCDRPIKARGICRTHYERWRSGDMDLNIQFQVRGSSEDRFLFYVDKDGPIASNNPELGQCWIWTSSQNDRRNRRGRGGFKSDKNGKTVSPYRWAYEHWIGTIPDGLVLDHFACDNGSGGCVNPWHCRPATNSENVQRALDKRSRMTHCCKGHELTPDNVYVTIICKTCRGGVVKPLPPQVILRIRTILGLDP
jgi:hypothetical protein